MPIIMCVLQKRHALIYIFYIYIFFLSLESWILQQCWRFLGLLVRYFNFCFCRNRRKFYFDCRLLLQKVFTNSILESKRTRIRWKTGTRTGCSTDSVLRKRNAQNRNNWSLRKIFWNVLHYKIWGDYFQKGASEVELLVYKISI